MVATSLPPLTDADLAAIEARVQQAPMMQSCCGAYHCDCHADMPRLLAELRRLRTPPRTYREWYATLPAHLRGQHAAAQARRRRVPGVCAQCGAAYVGIPARRYCSKRCRDRASEVRQQHERRCL